jgi:hypothetical protein
LRTGAPRSRAAVTLFMDFLPLERRIQQRRLFAFPQGGAGFADAGLALVDL